LSAKSTWPYPSGVAPKEESSHLSSSNAGVTYFYTVTADHLEHALTDTKALVGGRRSQEVLCLTVLLQFVKSCFVCASSLSFLLPPFKNSFRPVQFLSFQPGISSYCTQMKGECIHSPSSLKIIIICLSVGADLWLRTHGKPQTIQQALIHVDIGKNLCQCKNMEMVLTFLA